MQETSEAISPIVYAVPITDPDQAIGETPIYRNPQSLTRLTTHIKRLPHVKTLQDLHDHNSKAYADLNCLGSRKKLPLGSYGQYKFQTFKATYETARKVGSAILNLDFAPTMHEDGLKEHKLIAIYAKNCEEWMYLDIAGCLYGITVVPIFEILSPDSLDFIFNQTGITTVFASEDHIDILIDGSLKGKLSTLRSIICLSGYSSHRRKMALKANIELILWDNFVTFGEKIQPYPPVTPDTIFSLVYTSGTTGTPKAAVLTHGNIVAAIGGLEEFDEFGGNMLREGDVHLSYLPIAHIFERVFDHMLLTRGGTIGFFSGDIQRLREDLQALKPTFMIGVPRMYNRCYEAIQSMINLLSNGSSKPVSKKNAPDNEDSVPLKTAQDIAGSVLLGQMKLVTGGRVKAYVTGSAPIAPHVLEFLRVALSAPISEGYGQSETCSACCRQSFSDTSVGNIGGIFPNTEFKLVDLPEMNYTSKDKGPNGESLPRGELCLRGASIFKGYYREPEQTAKTIDKDGWHHTGDVAMLLPNGAIKLIDRKINIFKLAQGEFVAPEKIENIYLTNKYVSEVFVYGDSFQPNTVAVVVPNSVNLAKLGNELGFGEKNVDELCKEPRVIRRVLEDMNRTGKSSRLLRYELAQNIYLEPRSFVSLGLTTPSMKLRRDVARDYYGELLKKLYGPKPRL